MVCWSPEIPVATSTTFAGKLKTFGAQIATGTGKGAPPKAVSPSV